MRDILVHAVRYRERDPSVEYAARLAAALRASLTAIHVPPMIPVLPEYDVAAIIGEYAAWIGRETAAARAVAPEFEAWASSLGVACPQWQVADGQPAALLRHAGHWHDLLVLGLGGEDPWQGLTGVAELVLGTGLPCLVVPQDAASRDVRHACIAVAWNGSVEAIRALHAALPLLQAASRVVVLVGGQRAAAPGLPVFAIEAWCERHGLQVEYRMLDAGADTGGPILDAAHAVQADLLVLGAYGRSRLAEWALGGVTRHVLQHARLPLFMRH